jgi:hypothetical protein
VSQKPETLFRKKVVADLKKLERIKIFSISQTSIVGTPDLLICANSRFVALELKASPEAKIAALQKYNLDEITEAGGYAMVVHPKNWKFVLEKITAICDFY